MASTWCREGLRVLADAVFKTNATPAVKYVALFSNDQIIIGTTVYADLTLIASNGGEQKELVKATWDAATDADPVVSTYNGVTGVVFTFSGPITAYGWAVVGVASILYCAENFGVKTFVSGDTLTLLPFDMKFDIV